MLFTKESERELDADHTWNSRERVVFGGMEDHFARTDGVMVAVEELETFLFGQPM